MRDLHAPFVLSHIVHLICICSYRLHSQHNAERINAALSMYIDHDSKKKVEFANLNSEQFIY